MKHIIALLALGLLSAPAWTAPLRATQDIFPSQEKHVHGSSIIELPNGDFLSCWFHGSGERNSDDVKVNGARLIRGSSEWTPLFEMADTPGFPDCNPVLYLDAQERVWLFWIVVGANKWETSLLKYRRADDYSGTGAPAWTWQDIILLLPGDKFAEEMKQRLDEAGVNTEMWAEYGRPYEEQIVQAAEDKWKRRTGWMTRIHPLTLPSGRILLPLYSDGFNCSLAAISDDVGETWHASGPIAGFAPIQPAFVQAKDGAIHAFMRDSGGAPNRVMHSLSKDDGETWTASKDTPIPNPGSSLDVIQLDSGAWLMIANDTERGRRQLTALLSEDEGATWEWRRVIEPSDSEGSFAYPCVMQAKDGAVHMSYSTKTQAGATIRHTVINEEWIKAGK